MIVCKNVTKRYILGDEIWEMKDLNLEIEAKEFVAIKGISGSGKSTLLHLLGGLDLPCFGEILVDGQNIVTMSDKKRARFRNKKIGFVFQEFFLYPDINLVENVALPLTIAGISPMVKFKRAQEALNDVYLTGLEKHAINQISGGQRQRVAVARAIVHRPKILFADEPTGNLDTHTGKQIVELLMNLRKKHNMTLVVVTHDPEIARHADRIIELKDGRMVNKVKGQKSEVNNLKFKI